MSETTAIVVLNDGETWSALEGCKILHVTEAGMKKLEEGQEPNDLDSGDIVMEKEL